MFDRKKYHREYMRKYREDVIKKSPEKLERIRELDRLDYKKKRKDPEWVAKDRKWKREFMKRKRLNNLNFRKIETEQHKRYINTDKGKKLIRESIDKYCKANPERVKAWRATTYAKKTGKIKVLPCKVCGKIEGVHAHHPDPKRKLEVIFLCPLHHRRADLEIRNQSTIKQIE